MSRPRSMQAVAVVAFLFCGPAAARPASEPRPPGARSQDLIVFVGTYTRGDSLGIYRCRLDLGTGRLASLELAAETVNPSFLALHPSGRFLYAVGEIANFGGGKTGAVSAFQLDPKTGELAALNQQPSRGTGPCHLTVDRTGRSVLVANYGSGSVACPPIGDDGRLGEATSFVQHEGSSVNPRRQKGPHAHVVEVDPANRFAFVADLGLDKVLIYRLDVDRGQLVPSDPPWAAVAPGAGPRHLAFHPSSRFLYVINELDSTVTAFAYDARRGAMELLEAVSTLPDGFAAKNTTAEIAVHPSGRFLYGSNRGHDSLAIFAIDPDTGKLRCVGHESTRGETPRNFAIDPTGRYLLAANQDTDNVVVFRIDADTGKLHATGQSLEVPMPVCIVMMPPG